MFVEEALAVSDIVLTVNSTVGIEAIVADKPLVVFDPMYTDYVGYVRGEAGMVSHSEDELYSILQLIANDADLRDKTRQLGQCFLRRRVLGFGDGQAGVRSLMYIKQVCKK